MFFKESGILSSSKFIEKILKITKNVFYSQQLGTFGQGRSEPHLDDVIVLHVQLGWSLLGAQLDAVKQEGGGSVGPPGHMGHPGQVLGKDRAQGGVLDTHTHIDEEEKQ